MTKIQVLVLFVFLFTQMAAAQRPGTWKEPIKSHYVFPTNDNVKRTNQSKRWKGWKQQKSFTHNSNLSFGVYLTAKGSGVFAGGYNPQIGLPDKSEAAFFEGSTLEDVIQNALAFAFSSPSSEKLAFTGGAMTKRDFEKRNLRYQQFVWYLEKKFENDERLAREKAQKQHVQQARENAELIWEDENEEWEKSSRIGHAADVIGGPPKKPASVTVKDLGSHIVKAGGREYLEVRFAIPETASSNLRVTIIFEDSRDSSPWRHSSQKYVPMSAPDFSLTKYGERIKPGGRYKVISYASRPFLTGRYTIEAHVVD